MMNLFQSIQEFFVSYADFLVPAITLAAGWFFGRQRAQSTWRKREFFDRINISLNIIEQGELKIRTLIEKPSIEVFLNSQARQHVLEAAQKTTIDDSILPLADQNDYWFCLNPVLNELSERFADGFIKLDMGLPVETKEYLICLTCEVAPEVRQRKIRAMVIQKTLLINLPEEITFSRPEHVRRVHTLRQLAAEYQKQPDRFIDMEISM